MTDLIHWLSNTGYEISTGPFTHLQCVEVPLRHIRSVKF